MPGTEGHQSVKKVKAQEGTFPQMQHWAVSLGSPLIPLLIPQTWDKKVALFPVVKRLTSYLKCSLFPTQKLPPDWPLWEATVRAQICWAVPPTGVALTGHFPIRHPGASFPRHYWAQRQSSGSLMWCQRLGQRWCLRLKCRGSCKHPLCARQQENQEQDKGGAASGRAVYDIKGQLSSVHSWLQARLITPHRHTHKRKCTHIVHIHSAHTCTHTCTYMVHTQHMHKCTHSTDTCTWYTCAHIYMYVHVWPTYSTCTHIHIRTCTHINAHIYTGHTHMYTQYIYTVHTYICAHMVYTHVYTVHIHSAHSCTHICAHIVHTHIQYLHTCTHKVHNSEIYCLKSTNN